MTQRLRWWSVLLAREASESTTVKVQALTRARAVEVALDRAGKYGENLEWGLDDGNCREVYVSDPGGIEETDPPETPEKRDWGEHIRLSIANRLESGVPLTWDEYKSIIQSGGMNTYEREACLPVFTTEGLIKALQETLVNCRQPREPGVPCASSEESVLHRIVPELVRRLQAKG